MLSYTLQLVPKRWYPGTGGAGGLTALALGGRRAHPASPDTAGLSDIRRGVATSEADSGGCEHIALGIAIRHVLLLTTGTVVKSGVDKVRVVQRAPAGGVP